ncbi:MAG: hypothetical protein AAB288_14005, partial [Acidobacteriota bacterium]
NYAPMPAYIPSRAVVDAARILELERFHIRINEGRTASLIELQRMLRNKIHITPRIEADAINYLTKKNED